MKICKIEVNGARNFETAIVADFSQSTSDLITIFGRNGSGKTTLMRCALLLQQMAFLSGLDYAVFLKYKDNFIDILNKTVGDSEEWSICGLFSNGDQKYKLLATCRRSDQYDENDVDFIYQDQSVQVGSYELENGGQIFVFGYEGRMVELIEECVGDIQKMGWNSENPRNIMALIEAGRAYSSDSITLSKIDLSNTNSVDFLLDVVFRPFDTFSTIYNRVINDYLYERIIPQNVSTYLYHNVAKEIFNNLVDSPQIVNFSSKNNQNAISLMAKGKTRSKPYDVKDFSSGERCLISMLWYLFKANAVSNLIIDEPENHFHERLLVNFRKILFDVVNEGPFLSFLAKSGIEISGIEKYYATHKIDQIFLLTHSKKLIYTNLTRGGVYYLGEQISQVDYDVTEKILRECGLSEVGGRILFVEGVFDTTILQGLVESIGVKIIPLGNCEAVISTFEKIAPIRDKIVESDFCFLLDSDNRIDDLISRMKKVDNEYFDKAVVVMDCHEIENYLIDFRIYESIYKKYGIEFNGYDLRCQIRELADETRLECKNKSLALMNDRLVKGWSPKVTNKKMIKEEKYDDLVAGAQSEFQNLLNKFSLSKTEVDDLYSDHNWESNWDRLCDGKIVYHKLLPKVAKELQIEVRRLKSDIEKTVSGSVGDQDLKISEIISKIKRVFLE